MAACEVHGVAGDVSEKETVLLGLLAENASHAYGIEEKIRARRMENWTAIGFSSIYRLLNGLEERGLIEGRSEQGGQGASRKVFELTESGWMALARGVLACLDSLEPMRAPFGAGLANLCRAPYERVREGFERRQAQMKILQNELRQLEQEHGQLLERSELSDTDRKRYRLTLELVFEHARQHLLAECRFLARALERMADAGADIFSPPELLEQEATEKRQG